MLIGDRDPDALLDEQAAAELLGIKFRTLQSWRSKKKGPPFMRIGRTIRYQVRDLLNWIEKRRYTPMA